MASSNSSIGGKLTLGTETPQQDVIDGWNFKVEGAGASGTGAQALELDGLVPFVQLIGLYNEAEINKLLGRNFDTLQRTVEFVGSGRGAYDFGTNDGFDTYKENAEQQARNFEDKIKNNYISIYMKDQNITLDEAVEQKGIVLATNSAQAGNDAYEVINDIGTPKDSGGVGITDLQIETGTKDFMNRRYKLRMTITDPQVLDDKPEYVKLATLQSMFLIIHGWSNPDQLTAWPEHFEPAPVITEVGTEAYPNGRMIVDMSHKNTGGAWGAALVATTMYDFAFNEVGQLEATFTFMPREISFMHTMRIPTVAPIMQQVLNSGQTTESFDPEIPLAKPSPFIGASNVFNELGRNLVNIIAEEQAAYVQDAQTISSMFGDRFDGTIGGEAISSITDKLSEWSNSDEQWSNSETAAAGWEEDNEKKATARFPHAGVGIGTFMVTEETVTKDGEEKTYKHYTNRINYYYLGWILEAMRFSLWDLNKGKVSRGETPFDLKFRYMEVPRNSSLNYAVKDELSGGVIPTLAGFQAEASTFFQTNCMPPEPPKTDPATLILNAVIFDDRSRAVSEWTFFNILSQFGYALLDDELSSSREWKAMSRAEKIKHIPNRDYRKSCVVTESDINRPSEEESVRVIRILHPDFENQILYNIKPTFSDEAWAKHQIPKAENDRGSRATRETRTLRPPRVRIAGNYGTAVLHPKTNEMIAKSRSAGRVDVVSHTPGQGFWYQKANGRYIGDGIWAYMEKGVLYPLIAGRDSWTAGKDKSSNTMVKGSDYENNGQGSIYAGLIMPAVSARYFASDNYSTCQSYWYQQHHNFLYGGDSGTDPRGFPEIIKNRINQAIHQGLTMDDIAEEPVDLFWLTGKKYNRSGDYHSIAELNKNKPETLSAIDLTEHDRLVKERNDLTEESTKVNEELNSSIDTDADSVLWGQLETATTQFLDDPTNTSMLNTLSDTEDQLGGSENQEGVILGILNKVNFWENRIKVILKELISKDLINMENANFPARQLQTFTDSSVYVAPPNIRGLQDTQLGGNLWIKHELHNEQQPIPTDVFGGITLLANYDAIIVNPDVIINAVGYSNLMFSAAGMKRTSSQSGIEYGQEFTLYTGQDTGYVIPHNWAQMKESGAARYARWGFSNIGYRTGYNIGLPAAGQNYADAKGGVSPWTEVRRDSNYSPNIIVDMIGVLEDHTKNNYIFMNWVPQSMRDKYALAEEMLTDIAQGSQDEDFWTMANKQYDDYISNCRTLLKKYIRNKESFNERITFLNNEQIRYANSILTLQNDIDAIETTLRRRAANLNTTLSPFGENFPDDTVVVEPLGGGRKMYLNGARAQQIAYRFTKSEVVGVDDIMNYGPMQGGHPYKDPHAKRYGWANTNDPQLWSTDRTGIPGWDSSNREMINTEQASFHMAAGGELGTAPMQIAYLLQQDGRNPARRTQPGSDEANLYYIDPNSENNMVGKPDWNGQNRGRTVREFAESNQIDTGLLFSLFARAYEKDITIDQPEVYPAALVLDRTIPSGNPRPDMGTMGVWPTYIDISTAGNNSVDMLPGDAPAGVERWALYVDKDLDFIAPKVHLTGIKTSGSLHGSSHQNSNFLDTYPNKWYKLPWRLQAAEGVRLYPKANGNRIAEDEHLPALTEIAVRQLVRTERNGFTNRHRQQHKLDNDNSFDAQTDRGHYGGNAPAAYRGDIKAKAFQSSTRSSYKSSGGTQAVAAFPFGVPRNLDINVGDMDEAKDYGTGLAVGLYTTRTHRGYGRGSWSTLEYHGGSTSDGTTYSQGYGVQSIHDILNHLPHEFEYGFKTSVNNADVDFEGGEELNSGVKEWISHHYINLLPYGRRVAVSHTSGAVGVGAYHTLEAASQSDVTDFQSKVRDVTYGDLFSNTEATDGQGSNTSVDFGNKTVTNVAEIPIKRDVVDNLLSRQNTNMSIMQFVQQLITPSSIGVAGNVQIAGRNRNGIMELAVASVDYRGISNDLIQSSEKAFYGDPDTGVLPDSNRQPTDHLLFDYKRRNSLIENIDMSSKMDPAAFLTYQNSSSMIHGPGRDYNVLKLLSYEGIAEEFQEYLNGTPDINNAGETYSGIVNIGYGNKVTVDRARYSKISPTVLDGFVAQNPERWAKITSMMQGQNNFTTDLLAFYMRSVTLTIHGLTNISPFNLINVKGVMPNLEGIYIVTNVTDRITPGGFQTILEGKLMRRKDKVNEENDPRS